MEMIDSSEISPLASEHACMRLHTDDTMRFVSNGFAQISYSDGDDGTRSPWIIEHTSGIDTRLLEAALCTP